MYVYFKVASGWDGCVLYKLKGSKFSCFSRVTRFLLGCQGLVEVATRDFKESKTK